MTPNPADEWARCRPWLEAAIARDGGFYEIGDIEAAIAEGKAQFWPGVSAAVVTDFWPFPRFKALNLWLIGGDMDELLGAMLPAVEAWAMTQGCTRLIGFGRKGWARVSASYGFAPFSTAYVKEL